MSTEDRGHLAAATRRRATDVQTRARAPYDAWTATASRSPSSPSPTPPRCHGRCSTATRHFAPRSNGSAPRNIHPRHADPRLSARATPHSANDSTQRRRRPLTPQPEPPTPGRRSPNYSANSAAAGPGRGQPQVRPARATDPAAPVSDMSLTEDTLVIATFRTRNSR